LFAHATYANEDSLALNRCRKWRQCQKEVDSSVKSNVMMSRNNISKNAKNVTCTKLWAKHSKYSVRAKCYSQSIRALGCTFVTRRSFLLKSNSMSGYT
jgi:hypothetical protein